MYPSPNLIQALGHERAAELRLSAKRYVISRRQARRRTARPF